MRFLELLESQLPALVYHGTSVEQWMKDLGEHPEGFHVSNWTALPEDYARTRFFVNGETPIIVEFCLADLIDAGLTFEPNPNFKAEGYVETWQESLDRGAMVVRGFREEHKALGKVKRLRTPRRK